MSQGPRHINTDRSLNRPTEQRPTEASALHQVSLSGQPDFFQNEQPAPQRPEPPRQSAGGGRGGNGGDVTINGGAVTVTGGRFTLNRNGKTVDVIPASIGGGAGGIGGDGGTPANSSVNQPSDRWGTKGGIGETGYMNYNGDGGNLIVNGGKLSAVGNVRVGEDANRKGIQCAWADRNQGYSRGGYHCKIRRKLGIYLFLYGSSCALDDRQCGAGAESV